MENQLPFNVTSFDQFKQKISGISSLNSSNSYNSLSSFPVLNDTALYGLAGEIVRAIAANSECHPAALLMQLIVAFGSLAGFSPHFFTEADKQGTNLFTVIVGDSARAGRKGTAWGNIERLIFDVDADWKDKCYQSGGLSSGEGLVSRLSDTNPQAQDKRLLVVEGEFASVMRVKNREGNTLSDVLRNAWDRKRLAAMRRNNPEYATDPHVSFIGHITKTELSTLIHTTDLYNGYANRIIWCCSQRTKILPRGGQFHRQNNAGFVLRLKQAQDFAHGISEMDFNDEADALWTDIYTGFDESGDDKLDQLFARAEPIIIRLAMIYALLDTSRLVTRRHLEAAKALWDYSAASARYIFGGEQRLSKRAAKLVEYLTASPVGLTKTEIHHKFNRNLSADVVDGLIQEIESAGLGSFGGDRLALTANEVTNCTNLTN